MFFWWIYLVEIGGLSAQVSNPPLTSDALASRSPMASKVFPLCDTFLHKNFTAFFQGNGQYPEMFFSCHGHTLDRTFFKHIAAKWPLCVAEILYGKNVSLGDAPVPFCRHRRAPSFRRPSNGLQVHRGAHPRRSFRLLRRSPMCVEGGFGYNILSILDNYFVEKRFYLCLH